MTDTIAQHRVGGHESYSREFQFDDEHPEGPVLWWSSMPSGAPGSLTSWAGFPVDRPNALDMVRDRVSGLGGQLRVWLDPTGRATVEEVEG